MLLESLRPSTVVQLKDETAKELAAVERELMQYYAVLSGTPDPSQRAILERLYEQRSRRASLLRSRLAIYQSAHYQEGDRAILARTLLVA